MKPPRFSIIIPVYNVERYLSECLDSIVAQTFGDWEAVCVDDGSTDSSGAILDAYAAKDPRIHVFHQSNAGAGAARNTALDAMSQGQGYVWFVDADDTIHPRALEWLHTVFERYGGSSFCFGTASWITGETAPSAWPELPPLDTIERITRRNAKSCIAHKLGVCLAIIDRTQIGGITFKSLALGEDALFLQEFFWRSRKNWLCGEASLYFYRTRSDSAVRKQPTAKSVHDLLTSDKTILEMLEKHAGEWMFDEMKPCLEWYRNFVWYTFNNNIFRMQEGSNVAVVRLWCKTQLVVQRLLPENFYRRFAVRIVYLIPSITLLRIVVIGPGVIMRILRFVASLRLPSAAR